MPKQCEAISKSTGRQCGNEGDPALSGLCPIHATAYAERGRLLTLNGILIGGGPADAPGASPPPSPAPAPPEPEPAREAAPVAEFDPADDPAATPPPDAGWELPELDELAEPGGGDPAPPEWASDDAAPAAPDGGAAPEVGQLAQMGRPQWEQLARMAAKMGSAWMRRIGVAELEPEELDSLSWAWGWWLSEKMAEVDPNDPTGAVLMVTGMVLLPRAPAFVAARRGRQAMAQTGAGAKPEPAEAQATDWLTTAMGPG